MDSFKLKLSPSAIRDLDSLDLKTAEKVLDKAFLLESNPFPRGNIVKKIKGKKSAYYRLRVGKYRVFYFIEGREVVILKVVDKKDADKFIKTLGG